MIFSRLAGVGRIFQEGPLPSCLWLSVFLLTWYFSSLILPSTSSYSLH